MAAWSRFSFDSCKMYAMTRRIISPAAWDEADLFGIRTIQMRPHAQYSFFAQILCVCVSVYASKHTSSRQHPRGRFRISPQPDRGAGTKARGPVCRTRAACQIARRCFHATGRSPPERNPDPNSPRRINTRRKHPVTDIESFAEFVGPAKDLPRERRRGRAPSSRVPSGRSRKA